MLKEGSHGVVSFDPAPFGHFSHSNVVSLKNPKIKGRNYHKER